MTPSRESISLADLPRVGLARVLTVDGDDAASQRLRELGFTPGTEVDFVRTCTLRRSVGGATAWLPAALRPAEARRVRIETPTGGTA